MADGNQEVLRAGEGRGSSSEEVRGVDEDDDSDEDGLYDICKRAFL